MKTMLAATIVALIILALPLTSYAARNTYYTPPQIQPPCPSCHSPAYDRTPVPAIVGQQCGRGPSCACVDPWVQCGAFCTAGQLPAGWPYGWQSEYWLRPDSNF